MYVCMHVSNIHVSAVVMLDVRVFPCGVYLHNQTDTIQKVYIRLTNFLKENFDKLTAPHIPIYHSL